MYYVFNLLVHGLGGTSRTAEWSQCNILERSAMKLSWPDLNYCSHMCLVGVNKMLQDSLSRPRLETVTFRIQV
jgi:hypothetical protein